MDKWLVSYAAATLVFVAGSALTTAAINDPAVVGILAVISVIAVVIRVNFDRIFGEW